MPLRSGRNYLLPSPPPLTAQTESTVPAGTTVSGGAGSRVTSPTPNERFPSATRKRARNTSSSDEAGKPLAHRARTAPPTRAGTSSADVGFGRSSGVEASSTAQTQTRSPQYSVAFTQRIRELGIDPDHPIADLEQLSQWREPHGQTLQAWRVNQQTVLTWNKGPNADKIYDIVPDCDQACPSGERSKVWGQPHSSRAESLAAKPGYQRAKSSRKRPSSTLARACRSGCAPCGDQRVQHRIRE